VLAHRQLHPGPLNGAEALLLKRQHHLDRALERISYILFGDGGDRVVHRFLSRLFPVFP